MTLSGASTPSCSFMKCPGSCALAQCKITCELLNIYGLRTKYAGLQCL